jgi:dnd system-associated protein 4
MRRVRPPKLTDKVAERLVDGGPFESKQKLLMFAAALGKERGERTSFDSTSEGIRWEIFQRNRDDSLIFALAIAETDGLNVFDDEEFDRGITIFEEYAHTGLKRLRDEIMEVPGKDLEKLVQCIQKAQRDNSSGQLLDGMQEQDLEELGL